MTIKKYLRYCGFETENLGNGILVRNSYEGGHGGIDGGCYRAGASGNHVDSYDKVKGKGHDHRGSGIDYIKVFNVGANYHNPWIYDDQNANNWFIFFVQE